MYPTINTRNSSNRSIILEPCMPCCSIFVLSARYPGVASGPTKVDSAARGTNCPTPQCDRQLALRHYPPQEKIKASYVRMVCRLWF
jgi:hypothetical protein